MNRLATLALCAALGALALPASAPAKVMHFKGKSTEKPSLGSPHQVLTFDVTASKGRATRISNVYVQKALFSCQNHFQTERDVRFFKGAAIARSGKFDLRETELPPGADNWLSGQVKFPKTLKGKRTPLQVQGFLSLEFGYGLRRNEYNCISTAHFVATRVG